MSHARRNAIPYLALLLVLVVGAGGGYALAASKTKTITVCADKKTGILHLKTRGRCKRSQTRVTWNQRGPQGVPGSKGSAGPQGPRGPQGSQGPAASNVWGQVAGNGTLFAGQGLSVERTQTGTYQVTVTDPICALATNAPLVGVSDSNPPNGQLPGSKAFAVAWFELNTPSTFTVYTGYVLSGSFTAADRTFDIHDTCG